jgi:HK97 family phage major capsid protein
MEHMKDTGLSQTAQIDALQTKMDQALTSMNRTDIPAGMQVKEELVQLQTKEFGDWMMRGKEYDDTQYSELSEFEMKMLSSDNLRTGGHWMPTTMYNKILETVVKIDPMRSISNTVMLQDGDTLEGLYESGTLDAGWTSERAVAAERDTPEIDKWQIPTHPMYVFPRITQKMARLAAFDVERWLLGKYANAFALLEGNAFLTGSGVGRPKGIMTVAGITQRGAVVGTADHVQLVPTGDNTGIIPSFDVLKTMKAALADQYQPGASWIMNRSTFLQLDLLTDAVGSYMLQDNVTQATANYTDAPGEAMLLGKPVHFMYNMPTTTDTNIPIAYGDFNKAYTIVDAPGAFVIRDEQSDFGRIIFKTERLGVGGDVIDYDAYVGLLMHTAV